MLGLGTEHTYYYYLTPVDMRKGFNEINNRRMGVKNLRITTPFIRYF